jgi:uncharacterized protein YcbK (DUF882 family)
VLALPGAAVEQAITRGSVLLQMTKLYRFRMGLQVCGALLITASLLLSWPAAETATTAPPGRQYRLRLYHTHTGERLDIVYRRGSTYIPEAISKLDHYLRDHRTGDVHPFDPRLFDLLSDLTRAVGHPAGEIDVVCGYRTPWSNTFLRRRSSGVAAHSLHMQAMAIDIRMPGVATSQLRAAALALKRGGVGYYRQSDFVHVDVGRVRQW